MDSIASVLKNYSQPGQTAPPEEVHSHFEQAAQAAPPNALASALGGMFRSEQTPPFGQMVGQLFGSSSGSQRADLLNALLSNPATAGIVAKLAQSSGINIPGMSSGAITPEAAAQVPPEVVQQAAAQVEKHDPSIVDRVSQIYAQHPMLIKTLGVAAMGMALSHLAGRRT